MLNVTIAGNVKIKKVKKMKITVDTGDNRVISNYRDIKNKYYSVNLGDTDLLTQSGCYKQAIITLQFFDKKNGVLNTSMFAISDEKTLIMVNIELKGL